MGRQGNGELIITSKHEFFGEEDENLNLAWEDDCTTLSTVTKLHM